MSQDQRTPFLERDFSERIIALFILGLFGIMFWWSVYSPLEGAARGDEDVSYSMKAVAMQPLLLGWGLINLTLGPIATKIFGPMNKPSLIGWVTWGILFVLGFVAHFQIKAMLEGYGYFVS